MKDHQSVSSFLQITNVSRMHVAHDQAHRAYEAPPTVIVCIYKIHPCQRQNFHYGQIWYYDYFCNVSMYAFNTLYEIWLNSGH